jgi:5-methylcytosine-specific restriction endonuclease McrA
MRREQRSDEAKAWRKLYDTPQWKAARAAQLAMQPLCEECLTQDRMTAATVVNHKIPHKGDRELFFRGSNHQSVCKPHHDGPIQRAERVGYSGAVDDGGWPTDPNHPSNKGRR